MAAPKSDRVSCAALPSRREALALLAATGFVPAVAAAPGSPSRIMSRADYADRVAAIWYGQLLAVYLTLRFEHQVAAVEPIDSFPRRFDHAWIDDDWYYEMCAVRGFERYGIDMTVDQLGQQWLDNNCGAWGSSQVTLANLKRGIKGSEAGHPRYNRFWWTIGPVFSCDLYGALAPGMPNVAGQMARTYGSLNGHGEAVDGAVIWAGAISLGFFETDVRAAFRKAVQLVAPVSPYRRCVETVIAMAEAGASFDAVVAEVEARWRPVYPQSNNAVPNGGIAAASLWFGEGDFWTTINLASRAADFTDTDNSAASAIAVIGAMQGMKALPPELVAQLGDRLKGEHNNDVPFTPPVDEKISDLVARTAVIGEKIVAANGGAVRGVNLALTPQRAVTQPSQAFTLADLTRFWNPDWTLSRAGFGGLRGATYLEGDVLATYPQDDARGLVLSRTIVLSATPLLSFEVAAAADRSWELLVYVGNKKVHTAMVTASKGERIFKRIDCDLAAFSGKSVTIRLYQKVHNIGDHPAGTAFWRNIRIL